MTTLSASNGPVSTNLNPVVIATHDGCFHADDVCAVAALTIYYPNATILRTRDERKLATADIVVDVGGVYNAETDRFDHHQKGRAGGRENGILFSSFGLVWRHFSRRIVAAALTNVSDSLECFVSAQVDRDLVQPVDATDNGQGLYDGGRPVFEKVQTYSISSALSAFNPSWHEADRDFDAAFARAVEFAKQLLLREIHSAAGAYTARDMVGQAIIRSANGPIVVLDQFAPWGDQVRDEAPSALFCVFPSETGTWMVQAVNARAGTFESRRLLPEAWAGLRDAAFSEAVGLEDGVFCHPGRFICGAKSKGSALKLARLALRS